MDLARKCVDCRATPLGGWPDLGGQGFGLQATTETKWLGVAWKVGDHLKPVTIKPVSRISVEFRGRFRFLPRFSWCFRQRLLRFSSFFVVGFGGALWSVSLAGFASFFGFSAFSSF